MSEPFTKILIANRGEIACRIIDSAKKLGMATVAVYSETDRDSLHVERADEAYLLDPAEASRSYLDIEAILRAAKKSGAEAVHPGYGFLAENADFAAACREAGLVFIGPSPEAIRVMGSKAEAKELMQRAGIPVVPGYHGDEQGDAELIRRAAAIGYPLLVKASFGGGGKGMRVAETETELPGALESARREALAAFGDGSLLLEKYLSACRHVEIQVFADRSGRTVHLFERDCSLQRRHQKVIEEAPAPGLSESLRKRMGETAVLAARAIDYQNAGTAEFLLDEDGSFYFNEMNTRLQVEHPATEMLTGIDLVEWQIRVAAGEPLPARQEEIEKRGHAIEARIYAEDPGRDFLPTGGTLLHWRPPPQQPHLRLDSGVREGDQVGIEYDPLLAKLIAWGEGREEARLRLQRALSRFQATGVTTNLEFLANLVGHPLYAEGRFDTSFLALHRQQLLPPPGEPGYDGLALASLYLLLEQRQRASSEAAASSEPDSPWAQCSGWRLNGEYRQKIELRQGEKRYRVVARYRQQGFLLDLETTAVHASGRLGDDRAMEADLDGHKIAATVVRDGNWRTLFFGDRKLCFTLPDPFALPEAQEVLGGSLAAPMPGRIQQIKVEPGAPVRQGMPLLILEAMKMEHTIVAPSDGRVSRLNFRAGDLVSEGDVLLVIEAEEKG